MVCYWHDQESGNMDCYCAMCFFCCEIIANKITSFKENVFHQLCFRNILDLQTKGRICVVHKICV